MAGMICRLLVEQAGPLATFQDRGRPGLGRFGIPRSGPVDPPAFAAAQAAVGNRAEAGAIELAPGGITLRCIDGEAGFALCGPGFVADLDGAAIGGWVAGGLRPGMRLRIRQQGAGSGAGNWAYLAFAGTLAARAWRGSIATHALADLGGGRIAAGQVIAIDARATGGEIRALPPPPDAPITRARLVIGPQQRFFAAEVLGRLLHEPFRAAAAFDRMGRGLDGPPLPPLSLDMPSEPAVRGALQVDGAGRATLLLADHQTAGGYPKIAVLLEADVARLAQLPAGAPVRFAALDPMAANAATRADRQAAQAWLADVRHPATLAQRLAEANLISGAHAE